MNCKQVYHILWSDEQVCRWQRVKLFLHLIICPNCQNSRKFLKSLDKNIKIRGGRSRIDLKAFEGEITANLLKRLDHND